MQVLFPNEEVVLLLARMVAMLGPIDGEMLRDGQETHKYFTREYDLYYIDEVCGLTSFAPVRCIVKEVVEI